jgi:hypothetical protein
LFFQLFLKKLYDYPGIRRYNRAVNPGIFQQRHRKPGDFFRF